MLRRTLTTLLLAASLLACAPKSVINEQNKQRIPTYGSCFGKPILLEEDVHYYTGTRSFIAYDYYFDLCKPHKKTRFSWYTNGQTSTTVFYYYYGMDDNLRITITDFNSDGTVDTLRKDGIEYTDRNDPDRTERDKFQKFLVMERK